MQNRSLIEVANSTPLANAGADQSATEQEPVILSGVGSSDSGWVASIKK